MSSWHREHPELAGTDADPWMANPAHAAAAREVAMYQRFPNLDAMIAHAEENSTHICDPEHGCGTVQAEGDGSCRECGEKLWEREP